MTRLGVLLAVAACAGKPAASPSTPTGGAAGSPAGSDSAGAAGNADGTASAPGAPALVHPAVRSGKRTLLRKHAVPASVIVPAGFALTSRDAGEGVSTSSSRARRCRSGSRIPTAASTLTSSSSRSAAARSASTTRPSRPGTSGYGKARPTGSTRASRATAATAGCTTPPPAARSPPRGRTPSSRTRSAARSSLSSISRLLQGPGGGIVLAGQPQPVPPRGVRAALDEVVEQGA